VSRWRSRKKWWYVRSTEGEVLEAVLGMEKLLEEMNYEEL
jgi:hypothetical protein